MIVIPLALDGSNGFWVRVGIRVWLPNCICPGVAIGGTVPSRAEVIFQARVPSTQHDVPCPRSVFRCDGVVGAAVIQTGPVGPSGLPLSVEHVVSLVGADGDMDIWTLA